MKRLYTILIIAVMCISRSYAQDTTSLAGKMQFVFAQLNRSDISTGFLEERAFPLVSLTPFNGVLTDSNKVQLNTLRATYFTHYTACMLNTNPMLPIDSINNRINQYLPLTDTIPIAVHFGELNAFKSYAADNNLVSIDGDDVLHDVPGRSENPYLLKYLFAAAPLKDRFATGNFALVFKPNLFFTNSSLTVSALYIDFDDGNGYQNAGWNTVVYPNYSTAGTKNIRLKLVMSNSSQYECYAPITVADIPGLYRYAGTPVPTPINFPFVPFSHSGGNVYVRLSSTNSTSHLKKPLIVVEGYDVSLIAPDLADGNYGYEDFIRAINATNEQSYDFNYQLDDIAGYDLVFIDYFNGTDDIVRNANLFKEVLAWVNTDKANNSNAEQNVVLGISMGGLVARYGLAQMTKNNQTTDTRLLITHDSPHQGANVPVGIQKVVQALGQVELFGRKIADIFTQYGEAINVFNAPATQQLLTYRSASYNGAIETNTWLSGTYRPMITFSPTDPQPSYRFIATSQGSECGQQLFNPGSQLLNIQASGSGATAIIPGLHANLQAEIKANALPWKGWQGELAKVKIEAKVKYLFIRIKKETFNFSYSISQSPYLAIDGVAGGTSPIGAMNVANQSMGGVFWNFLAAYKLNLDQANLSNFTFVPTPSALDVQDYDEASLSSTYVSGVSYNNSSTAATFIAQQTINGTFNEAHTSFTARNAEWMFREMEGLTNTLNCETSCSPNLTIEGPSMLCETATYSIPNLPTGATVAWSAPGPINISGSNDYPLTVTKEANGTAGLIAFITTNCGTTVITKTITVGKPTWYAMLQGNETVKIYGLAQFSISAYPEATGYTWEVLDRWDAPASTGFVYGTGPSATGTFWDTGWYRIRVTAHSPCGDASTGDHSILVVPQDYYRMNVYPNPANTELNIALNTEENSLAKSVSSAPREITLYNNKSRAVKTATLRAGEAKTTIATGNLPDGTYFLHIKDGKEITKQQIIIKH